MANFTRNDIKIESEKEIDIGNRDAREFQFSVSSALGSAEYRVNCTGTLWEVLNDDSRGPMEALRLHVTGHAANQLNEDGHLFGATYNLDMYTSPANPMSAFPTPVVREQVDVKSDAYIEDVPSKLFEEHSIAYAYTVVCKLRKKINQSMSKIFGEDLFSLAEEHVIIEVFMKPTSNADFENRLNGLNKLTEWMNPTFTKKYDSKPIKGFEAFLLKENVCNASDAKFVYESLEAIREVRNTIHPFKDEYNWAFEKLGIKYPPEDYAADYEQVMGRYLKALKMIDAGLTKCQEVRRHADSTRGSDRKENKL